MIIAVMEVPGAVVHREERFLIQRNGNGKFQAISFFGYVSEAEGNSIDEIIAEIEGIEEVNFRRKYNVKG